MAEGGSANQSESSLTENSSSGVPLKVILLGVKGVGKTTLFRRIYGFKENNFSDEQCRNLTEYIKPVRTNDGRTVQMYLWDTAGMEGNKHERTLTRSHYVGTQVALLVYSADDWDSVEDLKMYVEDVESHAPGAKMLLVRNKMDLPKAERTVSEQEVDGMFKQHGHAKFTPNWKLKISALKGDGIEALLKEVGETLLKLGSLQPDGRNSFQVYRPRQEPESNSRPCC